MSQEPLLNQAIATVKGTMKDSGLVVDGQAIKTNLSCSYYAYLSSHPLTLPYEGYFRVWPRTNREGALTAVKVITPNPSTEGAIFSGKVISIGATLLTLRVRPVRKQIRPFLLTLLHDGIHRGDITIRCGWFMQFRCSFSEEDAKFHIREAISLKDLVVKSDTASADTQELVSSASSVLS